LGLAESCSVLPAKRDVEGAVTVTDESTAAAVTVTVVELCTVWPPAVAVAVIVVVPVATPVTRPLVLTVAIAGADELHVTVAVNAAPN
jgi:hypothetical protein